MDKQELAFKAKLTGLLGAGAMAMAIALTSHYEGTRTTPYHDVGAVMTVCRGHTGDVEKRNYTLAECDALQKADLTAALAEVDRDVKVPISEPTRAALADFVFNLGGFKFRHSTLLKRINAGEGARACDELLRWTKAAGAEQPGLAKRRAMEHYLCVTGFMPAS